MRATKIFLASLSAVFLALVLMAQSPLPRLTPMTNPAPVVVAPKEDLDLDGMIQSLQQIKVQNEETLKKQAAQLDTLDLIQKDADQMRIFTKRG